ncbi:MAG TPA: PEP-CTERM sorting domain-containing protein [Leptolyngbyaceae cyanobacterium]
MVTIKKWSMALGVVGAIASFAINAPVLAADRILWSIQFANKTYEIDISIAGVERFAQTGDISGLPPEFSFLNLTPEFQEYLQEQLTTPISSKSTLARHLENLLQLLLPTSSPEQRQVAVKLLVQKANGKTVINFLKGLPVDTITSDNFWGLLNGYQETLSLISTNTGQIGTIDTTTGVFTEVASGIAFPDIALSNEGNLFGVDQSNLYRIDLNSGVCSLIGHSGYMGGLGFSANNVLYGVSDGLYTIDTITGNSSLVADLPGSIGVGDIVFDPTNNRFLATPADSPNKLFSIDMNGAVTEIGDIGFANVWGLFFHNGTLFGYTGDRKQIVIDLATGRGTFDKTVTGTDGYLWGAASLPSTGPKTSVPEPASTLALLALGAFGVGSLLKHKQQQKVLNSVVSE